ncbi:carbon-nitrogen hydrolase family protein [Aspergillus ibericus CBS 121593]|uniref:nitrilase n=1 Tax=Aspergillus ibericus CBS 121593 TaxID=1448316 RepID=A0A395H8D2_9EURO|nr:carbon-nitrogen hydrolase [Aspergillus ibericus CBS 121593]RAL04167.1 carbon-nitrogen hydrolase [Aspergillus ibericus CBS 121593]
MTQVRVGAVQVEPGWVHLAASVAKTIALIKEAGAKGINVLGFLEVWIPGYLWTMWTGSVVENVDLMHQYMANSLRRDSAEMRAIQQAVKEAGLFIVLGYSERDGESLYMAQPFINTGGEIVHHRRKIKPTHVERSIWGEGQAESLQMVVDSPFGRIDGLNCWEHLQPLLRFYEYSQGVQIHVASWPPEFPAPKGLKWKQMWPPGGGFSAIFGADGACLVEAASGSEECILQADIDLQDIDYAKAIIDTVGHYSVVRYFKRREWSPAHCSRSAF